MSRRRVAIVGAGIGEQHLTGFLANAERFEVSVICDLDVARARPLVQRARDNGSDARFEQELDAVLDDASLDIIDICLPPRLHKTTVLAALARDKHVVCEKPLVASLADADEIASAASHSKGIVMPVFQYRFGNGLSQLLALMERGLAGKPLVATLETHWNRLADYYAVEWRGKWETEFGGAIVGHAIHAHDLLTRVLGPVTTVQASLATSVNPIETEDCAAIVFGMANGALVTSSVTLGSADDRSRLRFCFEHLSAESGLDPYNPATGPWQFVARGNELERNRHQALVDAVVAEQQSHAEGYARQFEMMDLALSGLAEIPVALAEARGSLELITAVYQSAASGERVSLPLANAARGYPDWSVGLARGE